MDKRDLRIEARQFFADNKWLDFYKAVAYSGYKDATEKQAEVMAEFALTIYARGLAEGRAQGLEEAAAYYDFDPLPNFAQLMRDRAAEIRKGEK